ncbi:hypothetical protein K501DRAFT_271590 [Backusella circina FSU 941]|nr:hypothetical protein K501DRAFT_271590 [Backusella circina FSU 941]
MLWTDFQQPMYNFQYNNTINESTNYSMAQLYTTGRKNSLNSSCSSTSEEEHSHYQQQQQPTRRKQQRRSKNKNIEDDEKRKNFLERNRQAALKCRQRKKQWLNNLQARVEYLSNDNEQLQIQANLMRDEVMHLRGILMAHKDCQLNNSKNMVLQDQLLQTSMSHYMNSA